MRRTRGYGRQEVKLDIEPVIPRTRREVVCPFLARDQSSESHYCLSESEEATELAETYVGSFCLKTRHLTCPRFTRADARARREARERRTAAEKVARAAPPMPPEEATTPESAPVTEPSSQPATPAPGMRQPPPRRPASQPPTSPVAASTQTPGAPATEGMGDRIQTGLDTTARESGTATPPTGPPWQPSESRPLVHEADSRPGQHRPVSPGAPSPRPRESGGAVLHAAGAPGTSATVEPRRDEVVAAPAAQEERTRPGRGLAWLVLVLSAVLAAVAVTVEVSGRAPGPRGHAALPPPPATRWTFAALPGSVTQAVLVFTNHGTHRITVHVTVTRPATATLPTVRVPANHSAKLQLPGPVRLSALRVRSSGPVVAERDVVQHDRATAAYGRPSG
jgi:hypothetical protein